MKLKMYIMALALLAVICTATVSKSIAGIYIDATINAIDPNQIIDPNVMECE